MPAEEDLAERVARLEERVRTFEQWARLILEVLPSSWLIAELASRLPDDEDRADERS